MATTADWVDAARPRTLLPAIAPVVAGTGVAAAFDRASAPRAILALVVAVALQIGVNYADEGSDGIRRPDAVTAATWSCFLVAAAAVSALAALATWWLLAPGALVLATAAARSRRRWYHPVAAFVLYGPLAVLGTTAAQTERVTALALAAAIPVGLLAVAATEPRERARAGELVAACVLLPFLAPLAMAIGYGHPAALLALLTLPLAGVTIAAVRRDPGAPEIDALSGQLALSFALLLALGLAL